MSKPALNHIAWSKVEPARHHHSLSESGVDAPDLEAMGLPSRAGLPAAGYALQPELERLFGARWGAPGGRVLLTSGGSEANALVVAALLERGDEILVESPGYEPHREVPRLFDITARRFDRRPGAGTALAEAVEASLTPATRMVVLTHLHNPTSEALSTESAAALTTMAERRGVWLLCDEIFRDAETGPLGTCAALGSRWVATSSLTKIYGLGGLRLGWIAGSDEVLARCAAVQNGFSVTPALPSIALALELTPHLDTLRARTHRMLSANHARWNELVAGGVPFSNPVPTRGTTTWVLFPRDGDGDAFAALASQRFSLALTPGRFFGVPRGLRVGLAAEPVRCAAALDTFARALAAFAAGEPVQENA